MAALDHCASRGCTDEPVMAIGSRNSREGGLITTVWQFPEDSPALTPRYCGRHGVALAAGLAALADSDLVGAYKITWPAPEPEPEPS